MESIPISLILIQKKDKLYKQFNFIARIGFILILSTSYFVLNSFILGKRQAQIEQIG